MGGVGGKETGNGVDLGALEGFFDGEGREGGGDPFRQHRLAGAGRPGQKPIMSKRLLSWPFCFVSHSPGREDRDLSAVGGRPVMSSSIFRFSKASDGSTKDIVCS